MTNSTNELLLTSEEAAKILNIPLLAIGQLVWEHRLVPVYVDGFRRYDVEQLKHDEDLLRRLR